MSVAKVEVVMDRNKAVRTIIEDVNGVAFEVPGVFETHVSIDTSGPMELTLKLYADVTVREPFPQELEGS